ncbi:MAG: ATP phosphoribosyltransferase [Oscillospiraceae bacterium]|nr:ATP phosphoribosyltransferase [Oscillospiraceae bacterium]
MTDKIKIALTKGRLEKQTAVLLKKAGFDTASLSDKGRRLIIPLSDDIDIVLAKAPDVVTYVEHGVCDIGIAGRDMLLEHQGRYYEIADIGLGKCRFALAGKKGADFFGKHGVKTVATKYPVVAKTYFDKKRVDVDIVRIEGSVELAPLLGLADAIVDIVETGATLYENGLEIYEDIIPVSARVIANTASLKLKKRTIEDFVSRLEKAALDND